MYALVYTSVDCFFVAGRVILITDGELQDGRTQDGRTAGRQDPQKPLQSNIRIRTYAHIHARACVPPSLHVYAHTHSCVCGGRVGEGKG